MTLVFFCDFPHLQAFSHKPLRTRTRELRMRLAIGSWLKRACAVSALKFGVIRGSFRFGGKKDHLKIGKV